MVEVISEDAERERGRRDGMDVVVGGGEKWREGVICHSVTTAAAGFSREWRHNLAAEMDATFGDGGRGNARGVRSVHVSVGVGGEGQGAMAVVNRLSGGGRQHVIKPERAFMMMLW